MIAEDYYHSIGNEMLIEKHLNFLESAEIYEIVEKIDN